MTAQSPRVASESGHLFQVFSPQLGDAVLTKVTITGTASPAAALGTTDSGRPAVLMNIRAPNGGRIRLAFFSAGGSNVATANSLMVGFSSDWETQLGIPAGATHWSAIRADGANVDIEIAWQ